MSTAVEERRSVGRKKKEIPSDYVSVKIPRDVYTNAVYIATVEKREIAQVIGDFSRDGLAKRAQELFSAANPPKRAKPSS
jgi:hypothetical protein